MANYGLNPNGLLDSGQELRGVTNSIEQALGNLNQLVQQYLLSNEGQTKQEYQRAQDTWNRGLAEMQSSLTQGAAAIDNIRDTYHVADVKGASLFQGHV
jgi:ESAT-6 family protein